LTASKSAKTIDPAGIGRIQKKYLRYSTYGRVSAALVSDVEQGATQVPKARRDARPVSDA
jgi:hypothetical protein